MNSNLIKLNPHCSICRMKDEEILKLKKEYRELQDKHITLLEKHLGISKPHPSKKPNLRVV